jgi:hypothetical protein
MNNATKKQIEGAAKVAAKFAEAKNTIALTKAEIATCTCPSRKEQLENYLEMLQIMLYR